MRDVTPTRSAAMALADEHRLLAQGYEFLDEKRMILASELLHQLGLRDACATRLDRESKAAQAALAAAVERHGLEGLQVYPPQAALTLPPLSSGSLLGLDLIIPPPPFDLQSTCSPAVDPSFEAEACRLAFARLVATALECGVIDGNLARLSREYRRTERRAKALERVLLPEVEETARHIDEQLDGMDREEISRVAWFGRRLK